LRRHIGHHLEEIALAALPPDIYQLGDEVENSSADSQTSPVHGMENNNANRLAPLVNVMENSDVESLVTSTHGVENSSANPPPPLQPPLVLSYEPTGDEALAEKIDYLGNILDGTSSVGRVAGSVENSSVKPPSPLQPPLVLSYESARHEALAERIDYLGNILDGTSSVGRVAGSVENSSVKPPSPLQPPLALSYEPAGHEALAERIGYLGNILDDSSTPQGGYQLPSQYQELKVPVSSTAESVFDQFLGSQQSWNHGGLLSYTSLPSQAPPPTGPPSVTYSMQHSPLHHQPKSKRSRPSKSQPLNEAVARSKASSNEAVAGSEVDSNEAVVGSVVGSDRTCHTCTIEFRFPCDLKSALSPNSRSWSALIPE